MNFFLWIVFTAIVVYTEKKKNLQVANWLSEQLLLWFLYFILPLVLVSNDGEERSRKFEIYEGVRGLNQENGCTQSLFFSMAHCFQF